MTGATFDCNLVSGYFFALLLGFYSLTLVYKTYAKLNATRKPM
ncbi:hypothetical protein COO91_03380 [Nostoc flagelliforme CCNUN1]|uniref:Uncharacterized protein n=1 Tax=Nostoc flagelliforme CCNUN1 TaxID=2038116 RepID=A0A2K8SRJ2_9NOSO|nr:hypothetical protein COO91_03380 [Nostoc flagelliforme CCNUN1]